MGQRRDTGGEGRLDGRTIVRFAHVFKDASGGVEAYLRSLNRALLERNRMTVVQMHLVREGEPQEVQTERVGEGTLLWIPSLLREAPPDAPCRTFAARVKRAIYRTAAAASPPLAARVGRLLSHGFMHYDATVCNSRLVQALDEARADLVVLHWVSDDCQEVVQGARQRGIPLLMLNHFDNSRFKLPLMKRCLPYAAAYGGVSPLRVPAALRKGFVDFSDGVDTDFFSPGDATSREPILLLPARLTPRKGHRDLIRAAALLKKMGVRATVVFAGREDSPAFVGELKGLVARLGLQEETVFTGYLSAAELRSWYRASAVVVLPSRSEGLGRVLLEAQAVATPVLAYDVGGVACAMRDGSTGYLVPDGDYRALAAKAKLLLSDAERREALGRNGRLFVQKHFSLAAFAARHEEIYLRCLRAPSGLPHKVSSSPPRLPGVPPHGARMLRSLLPSMRLPQFHESGLCRRCGGASVLGPYLKALSSACAAGAPLPCPAQGGPAARRR